MNQSELLPGLRLSCVQQTRFKTDLLSLNICCPLSKERNTKIALLARALKGQGGFCGSQEKLNAALGDLYGAVLSSHVSKRGDYQVLGLTLLCIADCFAFDGDKVGQNAAELLSGLLIAPLQNGFDEAVIALEKRNLKEEIEAQINDKRGYGLIRCRELMCEGTPYALSELGQIDDVDGISAQALQETLKELLANCPVEAFFIGRGEDEGRAARLKAPFEGFSRTSKPWALPAPKAKAETLRRVEEPMAVNQCKISLGLTTGITSGDPRFFALMMGNAIFGGGPNSKLFMHVRERLSLCYYAASMLDKQKGLLFVYAGVQQDQIERALSEILNQLKSLQAGEVSDAEFEAAKRLLLHSLRAIDDSPLRMQEHLLGEVLCGQGRSVAQVIEGLEQVDKAAAIAAMADVTADTVHIIRAEEGESQ